MSVNGKQIYISFIINHGIPCIPVIFSLL